MRRPFVFASFVLTLALAPALAFGQQQPPAQQDPPAQQQEKAPEPPKVAFTSPAGMLLVQIKPDQTAAFEEYVTKLKAGFAKTEDAALKEQAAGIKVFKAAEPFAGNVLYLIVMDPVVPNAEYEPFAMLQKTMTVEELRAPEAAEMWKRFQSAFAAGLGKLSLTPVGGGM